MLDKDLLITDTSKIILMADKKTYYKLDDIGIVGKQEIKSASYIKNHLKKTGDVLRQKSAASCLANSKSFTKKAS